jgi:hypothetical protein
MFHSLILRSARQKPPTHGEGACVQDAQQTCECLCTGQTSASSISGSSPGVGEKRSSGRRCIWNVEEGVGAACGWGVRLSYLRLGLGLPTSRGAICTVGDSSDYHVYHEPYPCYEPYHR